MSKRRRCLAKGSLPEETAWWHGYTFRMVLSYRRYRGGRGWCCLEQNDYKFPTSLPSFLSIKPSYIWFAPHAQQYYNLIVFPTVACVTLHIWWNEITSYISGPTVWIQRLYGILPEEENVRWELIDLLVHASGASVISKLNLFNVKIFFDTICDAYGAGWN